MKQKRERHTPLNPPQWGKKLNNSPPWRDAAFAAVRVFFIRHPEPSLFEGVRISFDTKAVILSGAFPREDLI